MKKLAWILAVLLLVSCTLAACSGEPQQSETENTETEEAPATEESEPETEPAAESETFPVQPLESETLPLLGGWTLESAIAGVIPQAAQAAFDAATQGVDGVAYTPLALAATQVVSGTNYAFVVKSAPVVENPVEKLAVVIVTAPAEGTPSVTGYLELQLTDFITKMPETPVQISAALPGSWTPAMDGGMYTMPEALATMLYQVEEQLLEKADGAMESLILLPLALLGTQVVNGTNYAMLCTACTENGESLVVVAANLSPAGETTCISVCPVSLTVPAIEEN